MEKSTGLVKVSRKQLLDPKASVPDDLSSEKYYVSSYESSNSDIDGSFDEALTENYTFPVTPPRKYSPEYFR